MGFFRRNLTISPFLRSVGVMAGGTAAAQAIMLAAAPVLSRLYVPENFGLFAVYASLSGILGCFATGRYELAIPLPKKPKEASNLASLGILCSLCFSVLITIVLFAIDTIPALKTVLIEIPKIFWLLPIGIFFQSSFQTLSYLCLRDKQFSAISASQIGKSGATASVQVAGSTLGGISLIYGTVVGAIAGSVALATICLRKKSLQTGSWSEIKHAAKTYRKFPIFTSWAVLLNTTGAQFPPLILAAIFSPASAGYYLLANRAISMPVSMISGAVGNVFLSHGAVMARDNRLGALTKKIFRTLVQIALLPALLICQFSPPIFTFVFGPEWYTSGLIVQWLVLMLFSQCVISPLSMVFGILQKNHVGLALQTLLFLTRIIALTAGIWKNNLVFCIALFSAGSATCYLVFGLLVFKYTGVPISELFSTIGKELTVSIGCLMPIILVTFLVEPPPFWFYLAIAATFILGALKYLLQFESKFHYSSGRVSKHESEHQGS